jgi:hypothetical protein
MVEGLIWFLGILMAAPIIVVGIAYILDAVRRFR